MICRCVKRFRRFRSGEFYPTSVAVKYLLFGKDCQKTKMLIAVTAFSAKIAGNKNRPTSTPLSGKNSQTLSGRCRCAEVDLVMHPSTLALGTKNFTRRISHRIPLDDLDLSEGRYIHYLYDLYDLAHDTGWELCNLA